MSPFDAVLFVIEIVDNLWRDEIDEGISHIGFGLYCKMKMCYKKVVGHVNEIILVFTVLIEAYFEILRCHGFGDILDHDRCPIIIEDL
jgi:hypothetical protein